MDIAAEPEARERLLRLGARSVPVLAKGEDYIFCQNLEDVAEFVGLQGSGQVPLPPGELISKWLKILRAAATDVRQLPDSKLGERAIAGRDRTLRLLGHHIFRIAEAFLETAAGGAEYSFRQANLPPAEGACLSAAEIAAYGEGVIGKLQGWWAGVEDRSCARRVKTFYGTPPLHQLLERSAWHSAQHARQLIAVLERLGIEPRARLAPEDLAGLPLPQGIWD